MTNTLATRLAASALLLGLLADQLLWDYGPTPLSFTVLLLAAIPLAAWLRRSTAAAGLTLVWRWGGLALACMLLMLWRSLEPVQVLLSLCTLGCIGLFVLQNGGLPLSRIHAGHIPAGLLAIVTALATRSAALLRDAIASRSRAGADTVAIVRGLLITLPLLLLFGHLFVSADAAFSRWLLAFDWATPFLPQHLLFVTVCCWIAGGSLSLAVQPATVDDSRWQVRLGTTETSLLLGSLAVAFTLFAGFQLDSLFSPAAVNVQRSGLTIAEFARHGFFQLLWIAVLALGLLTLLAPGSGSQPWFRRFAVVLLLCVAIVLVSAVQRTLYYLQSYGLSVDRLVAVTFIAWLGLCLLLFALTVLRGREGFVATASCLGLGLCLVLAVANPAALVVHTNVQLANAGTRALDATYLQQLGADAVPALVDDFAAVPATAQCELGRYLLGGWLDRDRSLPPLRRNWRFWQLAYPQAEAAVAAARERLQQAVDATCPAPASAAAP